MNRKIVWLVTLLVIFAVSMVSLLSCDEKIYSWQIIVQNRLSHEVSVRIGADYKTVYSDIIIPANETKTFEMKEDGNYGVVASFQNRLDSIVFFESVFVSNGNPATVTYEYGVEEIIIFNNLYSSGFDGGLSVRIDSTAPRRYTASLHVKKWESRIFGIPASGNYTVSSSLQNPFGSSYFSKEINISDGETVTIIVDKWDR